MHTPRAACLLWAVMAVRGAPAAVAPIDACGLLSPAAILKVSGEEVTNAKPSSQIAGAVRHAQCFYSLRTFTNSISLTLTGPASADRQAARELWQRWFHHDPEGAQEHDRDERKPATEAEEAGGHATPVSGIGDEAFWVPSFVGNLYVRKGSQFLRISLGGKMTDAERQSKAKALAAAAIGRLR